MVFVAYTISQENNVYSSSVDFSQGQAGDTYILLSKELITTNYLIYGLRAFKFSTAFSSFGIGLRVDYQFSLRGSFLKQISALKVGYLGVSVKANRICANCPGYHIYSGQSTQCVPKCDNSYFYQYSDGGQSCISCPAELNLTVFNLGCSCKAGYEEYQGKCLSYSDKYSISNSQMTSMTFSQASASNCLEPNTKYIQGSCICVDGYARSYQTGNC